MNESLKRVYKIGSDLSNEIKITGRYIDAFHAEIVFENGSYTIHDKSKHFGITINGDRINKPHQLKPTDHIKIATYVLHWKEEIDDLLFTRKAATERNDFYWYDFLKWRGRLDRNTFRAIFMLALTTPIIIFFGVPLIVWLGEWRDLYSHETGEFLISSLYPTIGVLAIYIFLAQTVKRIRDTGMSWWLFLIPGVNLYFLLTKNTNR